MTITEPAVAPACACARTSSSTAPTPPSRSTPTCSAPGSSATSSAATTAASGTASSTSTAAASTSPTPTPSTASTRPIPRSACRSTSRCADADATVARAEAAGATVLQPVDDRFYGSRSGTIRDPFGHQWQIDAPGTAHHRRGARREMADDGYTYETVDLGERAPADPPTRTELAAANATAPGVGYFTIDAPDPDRAAAFFGALLGWDARPSGQGFHIENVSPPGRHRRLGHRAGRHALLPGDDVTAAPPGPRARRHGARRGGPPVGGNARASTTRACPSALAARARIGGRGTRGPRGTDRRKQLAIQAVWRSSSSRRH